MNLPAANSLALGSLLLSAMAILLPLMAGVVARIFWFRRDADDAHLHPKEWVADSINDWRLYNPEPDLRFEVPWPDAEEPFREQPVLQTIPALNYTGVRVDLDDVRRAVKEIWTQLKADPTNPWPFASGAFEGSMPYVLGGAQGADERSATLLVTLVDSTDASERELLMSLWSNYFLPELRQRFGANEFNSE
jgi:hypothetical protein